MFETRRFNTGPHWTDNVRKRIADWREEFDDCGSEEFVIHVAMMHEMLLAEIAFKGENVDVLGSTRKRSE